MGAGKIIITDLFAERLDIAKKEFGATHTLKLSKDDTEADIVKKIHEALGEEPNVAIECSGAASSVRTALAATKSGGIAVMVGCATSDITLSLVSSLTREIDIRGVFRYCNDYPSALSLVASGRFNVKKLVTHHFDITETSEAFDVSRYGRDGAIKVMIHVKPRNQNNPTPF